MVEQQKLISSIGFSIRLAKKCGMSSVTIELLHEAQTQVRNFVSADGLEDLPISRSEVSMKLGGLDLLTASNEIEGREEVVTQFFDMEDHAGIHDEYGCDWTMSSPTASPKKRKNKRLKKKGNAHDEEALLQTGCDRAAKLRKEMEEKDRRIEGREKELEERRKVVEEILRLNHEIGLRFDMSEEEVSEQVAAIKRTKGTKVVEQIMDKRRRLMTELKEMTERWGQERERWNQERGR